MFCQMEFFQSTKEFSQKSESKRQIRQYFPKLVDLAIHLSLSGAMSAKHEQQHLPKGGLATMSLGRPKCGLKINSTGNQRVGTCSLSLCPPEVRITPFPYGGYRGRMAVSVLNNGELPLDFLDFLTHSVEGLKNTGGKAVLLPCVGWTQTRPLLTFLVHENNAPSALYTSILPWSLC